VPRVSYDKIKKRKAVKIQKCGRYVTAERREGVGHLSINVKRKK
jgi:hypothetical protein